MGLGKLNPGCSCTCSRFCPEEEIPVFSGWEFIQATSPGADPYAVIGMISWGTLAGTLRVYRNTVLISTQTNQASPEILALQSANNASADGNYSFVLETECGSVSVACSVCSLVGRMIANPPPDGDPFSPTYKMLYPGEVVNLCGFIPQWKIPTMGLSQRPASRLNPYSCVDASDMPTTNTGSLFWPN